MNRLRAFVACNLPVKVIESLRAYQQRLREAAEGWRAGISWTSPASFHLTLRFLGEIEEPLVAAIGDALRVAVQDLQPFEFTLEGANAFPSLARARVLWAGARGGSLSMLAARVNAALDQIGCEPEDKPFHGHITLGRLKTPLNLAAALPRVSLYPPATVKLEEIVLYRSTLTPSGAIYQALRHAALCEAAPPDHAEEET